MPKIRRWAIAGPRYNRAQPKTSTIQCRCTQLEGGRVVLRGVEEQWAAAGGLDQVRVESLDGLDVVCEQGADLAALATAADHLVSTQIPITPAAEGSGVGLGQPPLQEGRAQSGKTEAIVGEDLIERNLGQGDDVFFSDGRSNWSFRDLRAKTEVTMREDEAALGVVILHREDTIQTDAGTRVQPCEQTLTTGVPESIVELPAAKLRPDDKKAHEAEFTLVGGDGATADQFSCELGGDEGLGIGSPKKLGVIKAGTTP